MKRKTGEKFVSAKASSPQIRRTRVPNLGRWIIFTESTRNSYKIQKKIQIRRIQNKNKTCLSLTRLTNKSSSIPAHSVCAHLKHFAHRIQSSPLWSSDKRPVQNTQRPVPHLLPSNLQRKEQLGQCPNVMECQTELDLGKPFSYVFLKDQEEQSMLADWFWV